MPSPFPGMDPYLEDPLTWRSVHGALLTTLMSQLNNSLPEGLMAVIEDRVVISTQRSISPDVSIVRFATAPNRPDSRGGTATLARVMADPAVYVRHESPLPQRHVVIRTVRGELVTVIEVLSPTNKRAGKDREEYKNKQAELLASDVHLLEIDLLRGGEYTVAVAKDDVDAEGEWDYVCCLHYGGTGEEFEFWPISLRQRLPRVAIPLTNGHPNHVLDLQAALDRTYEDGPFARATSYQRAAVPPVREWDADWVDARLRERGLR
jgi:Protein of unknown function (DUF4058)